MALGCMRTSGSLVEPLRSWASLLAAAITLVGAVVGNSDSMEPFHRVGIGVPDPVWAHPFHEVVSIRTDHSHPSVHVMIRWVMPGTVKARTPRRRMDRDGVMAHLQLSCALEHHGEPFEPPSRRNGVPPDSDSRP
jgi:hypothetical protein